MKVQVQTSQCRRCGTLRRTTFKNRLFKRPMIVGQNYEAGNGDTTVCRATGRHDWLWLSGPRTDTFAVGF